MDAMQVSMAMDLRWAWELETNTAIESQCIPSARTICVVAAHDTAVVWYKQRKPLHFSAPAFGRMLSSLSLSAPMLQMLRLV